MNHPTHAPLPGSLRQPAGIHIEQGAIPPGNSADRPQVLPQLNTALTTEQTGLWHGFTSAATQTQTKDTP